MVDSLYNPISEQVEEDIKNQPLSELKKVNDLDFDDLFKSTIDSFLDIDSIKDLILDSPIKQELSELCSEKVEFSTMDRTNEVATDGISEKSEVQKEGSLNCLQLEPSENGASEKSLDKGSDTVIVKVEEEMGKFTISGTENERVDGQADNGDMIAEADIGNCCAANGSVADTVNKSEENDEVAISSRAESTGVDGSNGDKLKGDEDGSNSDAESESEHSSSSSASSSDDDEEDEEEEDESSSSEEAEGEVDMEEGEIQESDPDEMVAWNEDDEDTGAKGPIRSRNEVQVLPPVPAVTATLEPHHEMVPVGVVSSILGAQVVVEGVEKHTPLYDGSILWITESRSPLGIVDEIFGPVKNPYYIVRYNSDKEVPLEIHAGSLISFVPEFANHVLNDNSLYKKGYDASGENDEEVTEEEEFSDDEKEAEYRRMLKMKKRGATTNDQKLGNKKNDKRKLKNRSQNWKNDQAAATDAQRETANPPVDQSKRFNPAAAGSLSHGIHPRASFQGHGQNSRPPSVPPFPHMERAPGLPPPSTGVWTNGNPYQQAQNMGFPNTMPSIGMPWPQQMLPMPLPNAVPFDQQINPTLQSSFMFPGGQANFGAGPSFAPWPALGQNVFSQPPLTMGLPGQMAAIPMILGGQVPLNGPQTSQNNNSQPHAGVPGYINGSPNFNRGTQNFTQGTQSFNQSTQNFNQSTQSFNPSTQNFNQSPQNFTQGTQSFTQGTQNFNQSTKNNFQGTQKFNQGTHSGGGRRGNHRGGGRSGGRRGRIQRN